MTQDGDTYTTSELGEILGVGKRRVLQMLERGELTGDKDDLGRWLVPAPQVHALVAERQQQQDRRKRTKDGGKEGTPPVTSDVERELLDSLRDQVEFLRGELHRREERHAEEIRRRDHLLAAALERIPELEQARDAPGSPEKPSEKPQGTQAPEPRPTPQKGTQRRSLWRRIVGG